MIVTTNHVFAAFRDLIERTREWLAARVVDSLGYPKSVLVDRIGQRLVEVGLPPFARLVDRRIKHGQSPWPPSDGALDCGDANINVGSGAVSVVPALLLKSEREFIMHWTFALAAIVTGMWRRRSTRSAVLVFDLVDADVFDGTSDEKFVEFCRTGPVEVLREGQRRLIESRATAVSTAPSEFVYCRYPLAELIKDSPLGAVRRGSMLLRHLALFWTYHFAIARTPALALVARELAYTSVAASLDRAGALHAVVLTCSSYRHQPLWARARKAKTHMVWYAQNWKPTQKTADDVESDYPTTGWIRADVHWVWTEAFAAYLRSLVPGEVRAVGPIMWRLPETYTRDESAVSIVVFDVPAVSDEVMRDLNGEITNYLSPDNLKAFVGDVIRMKPRLEAALGRPVRIALKMKRGFRADYARGYFEFVDDLVKQGAISLTPAGQSVFQAIGESHLSIVYPYTSTAYAAEYLGVPAVFYDATRSIKRHTFADNQAAVSFAGNPHDLERLALSFLANNREADVEAR